MSLFVYSVHYVERGCGWAGCFKSAIEFAQQHDNVIVEFGLGQIACVSCLTNFDPVIGNSFCGFFEALAFGASSMNIPNRQTGRKMTDSVTTLPFYKNTIRKEINNVLLNPGSGASN